MSLDAALRKEMLGIYMRDPAQRAKLRDEAELRHARYMTWLLRQDTPADELASVANDHMRHLRWYFEQGGWRE